MTFVSEGDIAVSTVQGLAGELDIPIPNGKVVLVSALFGSSHQMLLQNYRNRYWLGIQIRCGSGPLPPTLPGRALGLHGPHGRRYGLRVVAVRSPNRPSPPWSKHRGHFGGHGTHYMSVIAPGSTITGACNTATYRAVWRRQI